MNPPSNTWPLTFTAPPERPAHRRRRRATPHLLFSRQHRATPNGHPRPRGLPASLPAARPAARLPAHPLLRLSECRRQKEMAARAGPPGLDPAAPQERRAHSRSALPKLQKAHGPAGPAGSRSPAACSMKTSSQILAPRPPENIPGRDRNPFAPTRLDPCQSGPCSLKMTTVLLRQQRNASAHNAQQPGTASTHTTIRSLRHP